MADLPILFADDVCELYMRADELAGRADYRCPLGVRSQGGEWGLNDLRDTAMSILAAVRSMPVAIQRDMFRIVCGSSWNEESWWSIVGELANRLPRDYTEKHGRGKVTLIVGTALREVRAEVQGGRRVRLADYAFAVGVQRQSLDDGGWRLLISEAQDLVRTLFSGACRQAEEMIEAKGLWEKPVRAGAERAPVGAT